MDPSCPRPNPNNVSAYLGPPRAQYPPNGAMQAPQQSRMDGDDIEDDDDDDGDDDDLLAAVLEQLQVMAPAIQTMIERSAKATTDALTQSLTQVVAALAEIAAKVSRLEIANARGGGGCSV